MTTATGARLTGLGAAEVRQRVRAGAWQRSPMFTLLDYPAMELCGKSLGIIGLGSIGQAVTIRPRAARLPGGWR